MIKHLKISSAICILTIFMILPFYSVLPNNIPVQIDSSGHIGSTLPKIIYLYLVPFGGFVINIFSYGLLISKGRTRIIEYYFVSIILILCISISLIIGLMTQTSHM